MSGQYDFSKGIQELEKLLGASDISISFLAGDGSDRTYHRVISKSGENLAVIMRVSDSDTIKLITGTYEWCAINTLLSNQGLHAPKIIGTVASINALVIEDFGNTMLENFVHSEKKQATLKKYEQVLAVINQMLQIKNDTQHVWNKRSFDQAKFEFELNFFKEHYLKNALNIQLAPEEESQLTLDITNISKYLSSYSKYFTHRDFHSRNILLVEDKIGLIDFQDARLGPPSYDLVSLVFDPYVSLNFKTRESLYNQYLESISDKDIKEEVIATVKPMALQRLLKAIGSFAYLTLDVKRGDYLKNVPAALTLLKQIDTSDKRWEFLSDKLINRLINLDAKQSSK